jgi:hypothetical protein
MVPDVKNLLGSFKSRMNTLFCWAPDRRIVNWFLPQRDGLDRRFAAFLNFLEVMTDFPDDLLPFWITQLLPQFMEMDDVVVMNLFRGNIVTEFKPNAVKEADFLGR